MKRCEEYFKEFYDSGYSFLSRGFMHNVFEKGDFIYKINKSGFEKYNEIELYRKEMEIMNFLFQKGISVAKVEKVFDKGELIKDYCVLKEQKLIGVTYTREKISRCQLLEIFQLYERINSIVINFGPFKLKDEVESFTNWDEYIKYLLEICEIAVKNFELVNLIEPCRRFFNKNNYTGRALMMIIDPNEENFIFDNNKIVGIVDVDHPIGGDPLYQWGTYLYHRPEQFEMLESIIVFTRIELEAIKYYALINAYIDVQFRSEVLTFKELNPWILKANKYIKDEFGKTL